jgi:hypothetical protein
MLLSIHHACDTPLVALTSQENSNATSMVVVVWWLLEVGDQE